MIENLLRKSGLTEAQVRQAQGRVSEPEVFISESVEKNSFAVVANDLHNDLKKAPKKKRR